MKIPQISKRQLIALGLIAFAVAGAGSGLWLFLYKQKVPAKMITAQRTRIGDLKIIRNPGANEEESESASSRRGGEKVAFTFQWGNQSLVRLTRKMEDAQAGLAAGDIHASAELKQGMIAVSNFLQDAAFETLSSAEIDDVIQYTLSGGRPDFAKKLLSVRKLSKSQSSILKGAVAFVEGDRKLAKQILEPVDAAEFKPFIAARVWMMKAELEDTLPYQLRRTMLSKAANYALGTLIEEAAIRRLVDLAVSGKSPEDFFYWSDRYMRRFSKSLYVGDFLANFIDGISAFEMAHKPLNFGQVDGIVHQFSREMTVQFANRVQSTALRFGEARLCEYGYLKSKELFRGEAPQNDSAELYALACRIKNTTKETLMRLSQYDGSKLSDADQKLYAAVNTLAQGIEFHTSTLPENLYGPQYPDPQFDVVNALAASVRQQLGNTDTVIKRIGK